MDVIIEMTGRFKRGKGIFIDGYFSETIIDTELNETYYDGHSNYESSERLCQLLNDMDEIVHNNWEIKKIIVEYETTDKYKYAEEALIKIKEVLK